MSILNSICKGLLLSTALIAMAMGATACGDDETNGGETTSSGAGCAAECATTACNDMSPDASCESCITTSCGAALSSCMNDVSGTCGASDCTRCGDLIGCDACGDSNTLDADAFEALIGLLECTCGEAGGP
jgi:hypothetical protein